MLSRLCPYYVAGGVIPLYAVEVNVLVTFLPKEFEGALTLRRIQSVKIECEHEVVSATGIKLTPTNWAEICFPVAVLTAAGVSRGPSPPGAEHVRWASRLDFAIESKEASLSGQSGESGQDRADMVRLIAGCDDALESLMRRHAKRLFSHLMRILRDKFDAQETVQEAFIRVYLHRQSFDLQARFSPWLYTIALNLARSRLRWRARHPEPLSLEAFDGQEEGDLMEDLQDPGRPPDQALEDREWSQSLSDAVARLPAKLRQPLILSVEDGRSHAEIAVELRCTAKAVEMRLYHARRRLGLVFEKNRRSARDFAMANVVVPINTKRL
jgi:RNA polymerase sigma-70 factor, ECF subfamily